MVKKGFKFEEVIKYPTGFIAYFTKPRTSKKYPGKDVRSITISTTDYNNVSIYKPRRKK